MFVHCTTYPWPLQHFLCLPRRWNVPGVLFLCYVMTSCSTFSIVLMSFINKRKACALRHSKRSTDFRTFCCIITTISLFLHWIADKGARSNYRAELIIPTVRTLERFAEGRKEGLSRTKSMLSFFKASSIPHTLFYAFMPGWRMAYTLHGHLG